MRRLKLTSKSINITCAELQLWHSELSSKLENKSSIVNIISFRIQQIHVTLCKSSSVNVSAYTYITSWHVLNGLFFCVAACPPNSFELSRHKCLFTPYLASATQRSVRHSYEEAMLQCERAFSWGSAGVVVMPRFSSEKQLLSAVLHSHG